MDMVLGGLVGCGGIEMLGLGEGVEGRVARGVTSRVTFIVP